MVKFTNKARLRSGHYGLRMERVGVQDSLTLMQNKKAFKRAVLKSTWKDIEHFATWHWEADFVERGQFVQRYKGTSM
jgi:hypothetical protein